MQIGDEVYYLDRMSNKIEHVKISGIDYSAGSSLYVLDNYFGYFNKHNLFKTLEEAKSALKKWKDVLDLQDSKEII